MNTRKHIVAALMLVVAVAAAVLVGAAAYSPFPQTLNPYEKPFTNYSNSIISELFEIETADSR